VQLDGKPVEYAFGGGVLWVRAPVSQDSRLVLAYSLQNSTSARDTSSTMPAFGAFHNTDVWHPFFHYLSANDLAQITAIVRIPAEDRLTTTIPQTNTDRGDVRTVTAQNSSDMSLLAMISHRDRQPMTASFGSILVKSFLG